jgi:hypothetical protein
MIERRRAGLSGILRVAALVLLFVGMSLGWLFHRAHARGERFLIDLGDHMMQYAGAAHQTEPQPLTINGASFFVRTGTVSASLDEVLDHFHAQCASRNGRLGEQWADVAQRRKLERPRAYGGLDGVFRGGNGREGVVACFETGRDAVPADELLQRARRAVETGELSALGDVRYVYAKPEASVTMFVALWSEGPLDIRRMFPSEGDAPGAEPAGVPRPMGTRRVLATNAKHGQALFNVYASRTEKAAQLANGYRDQLERAGFQIDKRDAALLAAHDASKMLTISIRDDAVSGGIVALAAQAEQGDESDFKRP